MSSRRRRFKSSYARGACAWLLCAATLGATAIVRMPLATALETLRAGGIKIVYSSDLVPPDLMIEPTAVTLDGVRTALAGTGLALVRRGSLWLLVQQADAGGANDDERPQAADAIENIIVTGTRHRLSSAGANVLSGEQLDGAPALGGDALRIANLLPGMATMGVSARTRIRGGTEDETLVLLDGVELIDPFHFTNYQNLFDAVDSRIVDDVDVYSGGFAARYGNRMSGVMQINSLEQRDKPRAEVGLSLYSVFANAREASPDAATQWLASVRYSESDLLIERLDLQAEQPDFADGYVRLSHTNDDGTIWHIGAIATDDDIQLGDDRENAAFTTRRGYLWSRLDAALGQSLSSSTTLSLVTSDHHEQDTSPPEEDVAGFLDDSLQFDRVALRSDFAHDTARMRQEFGIEAGWTHANYDSRALIHRGAVARLFGTSEIASHDIHETIDGLDAGIYWSGDFPLATDISLLIGARADLQTYLSGTAGQFSPRIALQWRPSDALTVAADAGRYHQPDAVYELDTADGVRHFYAPQSADHYIGRVAWETSAGTRLRLEAYQKRYGATQPRFENVFNPFVLLPQIAPDRMQLDVERALVNGLELERQDAWSERLSTIARYSYMDANDHVGGRWVPRRWSQRHTFNAIASWKSEHFTASVALAWHSGWRTTAPPASVAPGTTIPIESVLNDRHLRDYVSLDLGFSATRPFGAHSTITLLANLTNSLDRSNVVGIDYDVDETPTATTFSPDHASLLPMVPWLGLIVAF